AVGGGPEDRHGAGPLVGRRRGDGGVRVAAERADGADDDHDPHDHGPDHRLGALVLPRRMLCGLSAHQMIAAAMIAPVARCTVAETHTAGCGSGSTSSSPSLPGVATSSSTNA